MALATARPRNFWLIKLAAKKLKMMMSGTSVIIWMIDSTKTRRKVGCTIKARW